MQTSQLNSPQNTGRLENLSDGVFAVAMTLLVFDVTFPEPAPGQSLAQAFSGTWETIIIYVASFMVLGLFWLGHHILFRYIVTIDRTLVVVNLLLLVCISAVPFVAALLSDYSADPFAMRVYGVLFTLIGITYLWFWFHSKRAQLIDDRLPKYTQDTTTMIIVGTPAVYLLATGVTFIAPTASLILYIAAPVGYIFFTPLGELIGFYVKGEESNHHSG